MKKVFFILIYAVLIALPFMYANSHEPALNGVSEGLPENITAKQDRPEKETWHADQAESNPLLFNYAECKDTTEKIELTEEEHKKRICAHKFVWRKLRKNRSPLQYGELLRLSLLVVVAF